MALKPPFGLFGGMGSLGDVAGSPFIQWLASMFSSRKEEEAWDDYIKRVENQIRSAMRQAEERAERGPELYREEIGPAVRELEALRDRIGGGAQRLVDLTRKTGADFLSGVEERGDELMTGYGAGQAAFLDELGGRERDILGGYEQRYAFAQDQLDQLGTQQRADVERTFDEEQARVTMDLLGRGLLSSSEAARGGYDVAERRSAELRRLEEALARERIGTLSALSGEQLAAQERLGGQRAGYQFAGGQTAMQAQTALDAAQAAWEAAVRGDVLGAEQNVLNYDLATGEALADLYSDRAANLTNLYMQGTGDLLNTTMGINYAPPPQSNLPFMFGQNAVQPVQGPSRGSQWAPGALSAGGDIAGSLLTVKMLSGTCLDANAVLETRFGPVSLRDVKVGDQVRGTDGMFHRVTRKDCGQPYPQRQEDYVKLSAACGDEIRSVVLTRDHPINGIPVGLYRCGDSVGGTGRVIALEAHTAVESGDIMLDGCDAYYANGFPVDSMFSLLQEEAA